MDSDFDFHAAIRAYFRFSILAQYFGRNFSYNSVSHVELMFIFSCNVRLAFNLFQATIFHIKFSGYDLSKRQTGCLKAWRHRYTTHVWVCSIMILLNLCNEEFCSKYYEITRIKDFITSILLNCMVFLWLVFC